MQKISSLALIAGAILLLSIPSSAYDRRTVGLLGGFNFPNFLFGKVSVNATDHWAFDFQGSIGIFWTIQQIDAVYYFTRGEWSPYGGLGYQVWKFYGFSASTTYNGIGFGQGSNAAALTVPLGLLYLADNGFAVDVKVAMDFFVNAPSDLNGHAIPEGQIGFGYFF